MQFIPIFNVFKGKKCNYCRLSEPKCERRQGQPLINLIFVPGKGAGGSWKGQKEQVELVVLVHPTGFSTFRRMMGLQGHQVLSEERCWNR